MNFAKELSRLANQAAAENNKAAEVWAQEYIAAHQEKWKNKMLVEAKRGKHFVCIETKDTVKHPNVLKSAIHKCEDLASLSVEVDLEEIHFRWK
jgi:hypothetical protein